MNASKAHYAEDQVIPQRILASVTSGSHDLLITYGARKSGKHAFDYLTTWNRTVGAADPCLLVTPACGPAQGPNAFNLIPIDPQVGSGIQLPNQHFEINWAWEDSLARAAQALHQ